MGYFPPFSLLANVRSWTRARIIRKAEIQVILARAKLVLLQADVARG
jgi:hypothetical protein